MTTPDHPAGRGIVVGYDGSAEAGAAAAWAAEVARRTGDPLRLVIVMRPGTEGMDPAATSAQYLRELGHRLGDPQIERLRAGGDLDARAVVRIGSPRGELERAARGARLLVIGVRHRGRLARIATGSPTAHVLRSVRTPVVLVPVPAASGGTASPGPRRVVALTGPRSGGAVVDAAVAIAGLTGASLEAVRATHGVGGEPAPAGEHDVHGTLSRRDGPTVPYRVHDGPVTDLVEDRALDAGDLVVLGRHPAHRVGFPRGDGTVDVVVGAPRCPVMVVADDGPDAVASARGLSAGGSARTADAVAGPVQR